MDNALERVKPFVDAVHCFFSAPDPQSRKEAEKYLWIAIQRGSLIKYTALLLSSDEEAVRFMAAVAALRFFKARGDFIPTSTKEKLSLSLLSFIQKDPQQTHPSTRIIWNCFPFLWRGPECIDQISQLMDMCITFEQKVSFLTSILEASGENPHPKYIEIGFAMLQSFPPCESWARLCLAIGKCDLGSDGEQMLSQVALAFPKLVEFDEFKWVSLSVLDCFIQKSSEHGILQLATFRIAYQLSAVIRDLLSKPGESLRAPFKFFYRMWKVLLSIDEPSTDVLTFFLTDGAQEFSESVQFMITNMPSFRKFALELVDMAINLGNLTFYVGEDMNIPEDCKNRYFLISMNLLTSILNLDECMIERTLQFRQIYNLYGDVSRQLLQSLPTERPTAFFKMMTLWSDHIDESFVRDVVAHINDFKQVVSWQTLLNFVCSIPGECCAPILYEAAITCTDHAASSLRYFVETHDLSEETRRLLVATLTERILPNKQSLSVASYVDALTSLCWILPPSENASVCEIMFGEWVASHGVFSNLEDWLVIPLRCSHELKAKSFDFVAFHARVCTFLLTQCCPIWTEEDGNVVDILARIVLFALEHSACQASEIPNLIEWVHVSMTWQPTVSHFLAMVLIFHQSPELWHFSDFLAVFDPGNVTDTQIRTKIIEVIANFLGHLLVKGDPAIAFRAIPLPLIKRCLKIPDTPSMYHVILQNRSRIPSEVLEELQGGA